MLAEPARFHTRESLADAITRRFGRTTRFHTCSASGMTAMQLVEFLAGRGKIARSAGGFVVDPGRLCRH